jgi:hypothetical protein
MQAQGLPMGKVIFLLLDNSHLFVNKYKKEGTIIFFS